MLIPQTCSINAPTLTSQCYGTCILVIMPTSKRALLQVDALLEMDILSVESGRLYAHCRFAIQGSTESLLLLLKNARYVYYQKLTSAGKQEQRTANCVPKCLKLLYYGTWLTTQRSLVGSLKVCRRVELTSVWHSIPNTNCTFTNIAT